jgi:site-specific DNA-methyltransferase (adenine-specific)
MTPDTIYTGDNVATLKTFPDACIDLVVTSPPYDNLRTYGGHTWDFEGVARELTRVLKPGGVIVWVVADATVNGSETLTSMRQAIHFKDVCGLRVHDTMIYRKNSYVPLNHSRYEQSWEYMFVFSKGRPAAWNPIRIPCVTVGTKRWRGNEKQREASYAMKAVEKYTEVKPDKTAPNIFTYDVGKNERTKHNAPFPLGLARDHILSWSNEGDVVLDPFAGSGTTCLAARDAGRRYVGIEINAEYVEIINRRLGLANPKAHDLRSNIVEPVVGSLNL